MQNVQNIRQPDGVKPLGRILENLFIMGIVLLLTQSLLPLQFFTWFHIFNLPLLASVLYIQTDDRAEIYGIKMFNVFFLHRVGLQTAGPGCVHRPRTQV